MSRYTISENDLICTIGMDFTCQFWATDHRGQPLPMNHPCKLTVQDKLGQTLFETEDENPDKVADPTLIPAPENGVLQLTIPRAVTSEWFASVNYYDVWATILDSQAGDTFPQGQHLPIAQGRFIIRNRTTELEG